MSLSPAELAAIAAELAAVLPGAHVQKVYAPSHSTAVIALRLPGQTVLLRLDVTPSVEHAGVIDQKPPSPTPSLAEQGQWRLHLIGARVDRVQRHDRALRIDFSTDTGVRSVVAELNRGGRLLLLGAQDRVLGQMPPGKREAFEWTGSDAIGDPLAAAHELRASREIAARFAANAQNAQSSSARTELLAQLKAARRRNARTLEKVQADQARIAESARYLEFGDLLKPLISRIPRGATTVRATAYGAEGAREVDVPLLAKLGPRENMERYYHLHRRLSRSADRVAERVALLTARQAELDATIAQAQSAADDRLDAIRTDAHHRQLLKDRVESDDVGRPVQLTRLPYRAFRSSTGAAIWVGRNAKANDALTFRNTNGNDLWLHIRGVAGSHVVVPGAPPGPDGETLIDAAELAVHFSVARDERTVDVAATRCKYVRKVRGTPGAVTYSQEKTIQLRREPERLVRLLAGEEK